MVSGVPARGRGIVGDVMKYLVNLSGSQKV